MDSSGSAHGGLPSGLYTLTSSHPLDLQQIGTRREGKKLRLSQLEPKWHHDPGGSVYQLTHTDSQIYKHISHTLNVTLRLNYGLCTLLWTSAPVSYNTHTRHQRQMINAGTVADQRASGHGYIP